MLKYNNKCKIVKPKSKTSQWSWVPNIKIIYTRICMVHIIDKKIKFKITATEGDFVNVVQKRGLHFDVDDW